MQMPTGMVRDGDKYARLGRFDKHRFVESPCYYSIHLCDSTYAVDAQTGRLTG